MYPYEERMQAENAALVEAVAALRRENMELEKTRYRLQLEVDVLKKADEILKRGGRQSEQPEQAGKDRSD